MFKTLHAKLLLGQFGVEYLTENSPMIDAFVILVFSTEDFANLRRYFLGILVRKGTDIDLPRVLD